MPSLEAKRTSSATDPACIFCITFPLFLTYLLTNSLLEQAGDDAPEHVPFARGQGGVPAAKLAELLSFGARRAIALNRAANGVEQILLSEGLGQELDGAGDGREVEQLTAHVISARARTRGTDAWTAQRPAPAARYWMRSMAARDRATTSGGKGMYPSSTP